MLKFHQPDLGVTADILAGAAMSQAICGNPSRFPAASGSDVSSEENVFLDPDAELAGFLLFPELFVLLHLD